MSVDALPVQMVSELEEQQGVPWLVEGLWTQQGVGLLCGSPKSCLCRARHKQHYPVSRVMPRDPKFRPEKPVARPFPGGQRGITGALLSTGNGAELEDRCWTFTS